MPILKEAHLKRENSAYERPNSTCFTRGRHFSEKPIKCGTEIAFIFNIIFNNMVRRAST